MGNRGSGKADHTSQNVNFDLQPSFPTMQWCRRFYWKEVVLKAQTFNWCCKSGITLLANHFLIGYGDWSTGGISHLVMKNWIKRSWLGTAQPRTYNCYVELPCSQIAFYYFNAHRLVLLSPLVRIFFFCNG